MNEFVNVVVGYDEREAVAYHTCIESIISNSSTHINITPLCLKHFKKYRENHTDGSNEFIYSRFLVPYLFNFKGWAIYIDGDMVCLDDIKKLWDLRDNKFATQVVKHEYKTKMSKKYFGNKNENYPRKNWSSVILWNCEHEDNKCLTPEFVSRKSGAFLHRFKWLKDDQIGEIDKTWNWLAIEYNDNPKAKLVHYTLGTPCFDKFYDTSMSSHWKRFFKKMLTGIETKIKL